MSPQSSLPCLPASKHWSSSSPHYTHHYRKACPAACASTTALLPQRPAATTAPNFAAHSSQAQAVSLENRIGSQLFNRIGIVALLIGATRF